jgi:RNase P/RNase MRP subunit p29
MIEMLRHSFQSFALQKRVGRLASKAMQKILLGILFIGLAVPGISEAGGKIRLINGSLLCGEVVSSDEDTVVYKMMNKVLTIPREQIQERGKSDEPSATTEKIRLYDGSVLYGEVVSMDENTMVFKVLDQELAFSKDQIKLPDYKSRREYKDVLWGLGADMGLFGWGVHNFLKSGRTTWFLGAFNTPTYTWMMNTKLEYDLFQWKNKRLFAYGGLSEGKWAVSQPANSLLGVGFGFGALLNRIEVSGNIGFMRSLNDDSFNNIDTKSEFFLLWFIMDSRVAVTYCF